MADGGCDQELSVELEDAATRSPLAAVLGIMAEVTQQWHFVGLVDGQVRYRSPTFAGPYSVGHLPLGATMTPQEAWAPGMTAALQDLRGQLAEDGWSVSGAAGPQPWALRFRRTSQAAG